MYSRNTRSGRDYSSNARNNRRPPVPEVPTSMLVEYEKLVDKSKSLVNGCAGDTKWMLKAAANSFGQSLDHLAQKGHLVGNSAKLQQVSKTFEEQKKEVEKITSELGESVKEHIVRLQKVAATINDVCKSVDEEDQPPSKKKKDAKKEQTPDARSDLEIEVEMDRGEVGSIVELKNTNETLTVHLKVTYRHDNCRMLNVDGEVIPDSTVLNIAPGDTLKLTLCHYYAYENMIGDGEHLRHHEYTEDHKIEFAYTTQQPVAETDWQFVWVPYRIEMMF